MNYKQYRTIFQILFLGFKKGWNTPTLPCDIYNLHNNVIIQLIRVLGGLIIILIFTTKLETLGNNNITLLWLCTVFGLMFGFYLMFINYHRIIYTYKHLKKNKVNWIYPLDRFSTISAKLLIIIKVFLI